MTRWIGKSGVQLCLLALVASLAFYARTIVSAVQESMRVGLALSDNQIAFLQGPALAIPIALASVPIGIMVDRWKRRWIILIAITIVATASFASAMAPGFATLLVARAALAVAGMATWLCAVSMLADLFSPERRGRANMVMMIAQLLCSSMSFTIAGYLWSASGEGDDAWRGIIGWMSLPLVLGVLAAIWLGEPPREKSDMKAPAKGPTRAALLASLWAHRARILPLLAGLSVADIALGAVLVWTLPAFSRAYNAAPDQIGVAMTVIMFAGGIVGPALGGFAADFCQGRGGPRLTAKVLVALTLLAACAAPFALAPNLESAVALTILFYTLMVAGGAVAQALLLVSIPAELRGTTVALTSAAAILFGIGIAPLVVSFSATLLGGPGAVGLALTLTCFIANVIGGLILLLGVKAFPPKSESEAIEMSSRQARAPI